jgi:hypothetical protein
MTREQAHDWTVPWVEGEGSPHPADRMVEGVLQSLHGVTMAYDSAAPCQVHHGPPGTYVKSMGDIQADHQRWEEDCAEYDAGPAGYLASRRQVAEKYLQAEQLRWVTPGGDGDLPH